MLLALLVSMASYAQGLLGTVIDENGDPVIGATVVEKANPQNATITDFDGKFNLKADTRKIRRQPLSIKRPGHRNRSSGAPWGRCTRQPFPIS